MTNTMMISIAPLVYQALGLDDTVLQKELGVTVEKVRTKFYWVTGSAEAISTVMDDVLSRSSDAGGWDQPKNWERACKRAWPRLVHQVEVNGTHRVEVTGPVGRVRIVACCAEQNAQGQRCRLAEGHAWSHSYGLGGQVAADLVGGR